MELNASYGIWANRARIVVGNSTIDENSVGVYAFGMGGAVSITFAASLFSYNGAGVFVANADVTMTGCTITESACYGIWVDVGSSVARLAGNTITRNLYGIFSYGAVYSAGDNMIDGNNTNTSGTAIMPANKV